MQQECWNTEDVSHFHTSIYILSLLSLAVDRKSNTFRFQDVTTLFAAVAHNENGRELAFNFLLENWDQILKR